MAAVQVIGPVGADDRDPFPVQHAAQERQQVTRRPVGPVQVLEYEQDRVRVRQLGEQAKDSAEQLLPGQARAVPVERLAAALVRQQAAEHGAARERVEQRRHHRRRLGGVPQGVREWQVRDTVADLGAMAAKDRESPLVRQWRQLTDEPCLADPRVTADQRDNGLARCGLVEAREQPAELIGPANQRSMRGLRQHMAEYRTGA